eukprot:scaffold22788_cov128-Isochrysis_galbana.AAC.7
MERIKQGTQGKMGASESNPRPPHAPLWFESDERRRGRRHIWEIGASAMAVYEDIHTLRPHPTSSEGGMEGS